MKTHLASLTLVSLLLLLVACGQKSNDQEKIDQAPVESPNQILYNEVMKVHDEVMPKMNDMYKIQQGLKKKIEDTPAMAEEQKKEIEASIAKLDSANEGMMIWMREFNPIPDSLGEEKARVYLENEMVKVQKVKKDIDEALSVIR